MHKEKVQNAVDAELNVVLSHCSCSFQPMTVLLLAMICKQHTVMQHTVIQHTVIQRYTYILCENGTRAYYMLQIDAK